MVCWRSDRRKHKVNQQHAVWIQLHSTAGEENCQTDKGVYCELAKPG